MRKWLCTLLLTLALAGSAFGQAPKDEPAREPPAAWVPYSLAAVGALVAILIVWLPVRRN